MRLKTFQTITTAALTIMLLSANSSYATHYGRLGGIQQAQPTSPDDADPISGEWHITFHNRVRAIHATFTFILDGNKITGTAYSDHTGAGTIRAGK